VSQPVPRRSAAAQKGALQNENKTNAIPTPVRAPAWESVPFAAFSRGAPRRDVVI